MDMHDVLKSRLEAREFHPFFLTASGGTFRIDRTEQVELSEDSATVLFFRTRQTIPRNELRAIISTSVCRLFTPRARP